MKEFEVTIGIPVYRAVDYIEQTMLSALNQTFPSIEFLVIDDCGNDGTITIVEHLQRIHPRGADIRILYNERNMGVGVTRNRILDEARGHYLYFLDSDDLIEPDTIQLLMSNAKEFQAEVVYGSLDRIDKVNFLPTKSFILPEVQFLLGDEMATFAFKNYNSFQISVCNCMMDLDFLRYHQLRFVDSVFWEDLAFTYEMVTKINRAILLSVVTYHYICRPGSLSHYQDREQLRKSEILKNISTLDYLKEKCKSLKDKVYIPYLCYNLEMNSFYCVCHVIKKAHSIFPQIEGMELRLFMRYPLPFMDVIQFREKRLHNIVLWLVAHLPVPLFIPVVKQMGRIKGIL